MPFRIESTIELSLLFGLDRLWLDIFCVVQIKNTYLCLKVFFDFLSKDVKLGFDKALIKNNSFFGKQFLIRQFCL